MCRRRLFVIVTAWFCCAAVAYGQELELHAADPAQATSTESARADVTDAELELGKPDLPPRPDATEHAASTFPAAREIEGDPIERGPIHEAFAEPLELTPRPTAILKKAPPAAIEELAPEITPNEKNMQWISGYWAWDEQREDYVWVSGVWRKMPVGREWIPGRWQEADGGHQWVPGVWLKVAEERGATASEVLPTPPDTLEEGPTSDAPSDEHFWIPGVWKRDTRGQYAWRAGFWSKSYENWVWVPDHYVWTPGGCRFVAGYWDYPWERRGTLYAPCHFGRADLSGRVCYRPTRLIQSTGWLANLWVGPRHSHYYYGDYYGYAGRGYTPWYRYYGSNRRCYDPFYSYYRLRFPRSYGVGLYGYLDGLHSHYSHHSRSRPRVSFSAHRNGHPHTYSKSSLYGNVRDLHGRLGRDLHRGAHLHDDVFGGRRRHPRARHLDAHDISRQRQQQRAPERRLIGYANGQALYSDQRERESRGITRAQIGTANAPGITRSQIGVHPRGSNDNASARRESNRRNSIDQVRRMMERNRQSKPHVTARPNITERSTPARNRATPAARNRNLPSALQKPQRRVSQPAPKAQVARQKSRNRPSARAARPPQLSRPSPRVSTPQVSRPASRPSRASSPGFSTHSMKKARGANLARQRAAMLNRMKQKKGKK